MSIRAYGYLVHLSHIILEGIRSVFRVPSQILHPTCSPYISWDHFGTILGPYWDHFGTILEPFWDHFGTNLGLSQDHFGIIIGPFLDHFGTILGSFWVPYYVDLFWPILTYGDLFLPMRTYVDTKLSMSSVAPSATEEGAKGPHKWTDFGVWGV